MEMVLEGRPSFTQLLDHGLQADVALASWCPTMDLLALATVDGQLHVHRLNWQRLWWSAPTPRITALAWRPDGKQLAVGLEDGTLLLLEAEDGEQSRKEALLAGPVASLSWVEAPVGKGGAAARASAAEQRARRLFPRVPPPPPPGSAAPAPATIGYGSLHPSGGAAAARALAWPPLPRALGLLAAASQRGDLVLCTSNLLPVARASLRALLEQPGLAVHEVALSPDLRQLAVAWVDQAPGGLAHATALATGALAAAAPDLVAVGTAASALRELCEVLQAALDGVREEWGAARRALDAADAKLKEALRDNGEPDMDTATVYRELLTVNPMTVREFLLHGLGEAGVKKLARCVDGAVCAAHALITDHAAPAAEQLAFRWGQLRGLAAASRAANAVGLQAGEPLLAEAGALRAVSGLDLLRAELVEVGALHRAFFLWLLAQLRRLTEDTSDVMAGYPRWASDDVARFLDRCHGVDSVTPLLGSADDVARIGAAVARRLEAVQQTFQAATAGGSALGANEAALQLGMDGPPMLGLDVAYLREALAKALQRVPEALSRSLVPLQTVAVGPSPRALRVAYAAPGRPSVAAAWQEGARAVVALLAVEPVEAQVRGAVVELPEGAELADAAFYRGAALKLLLNPFGGEAAGGGGTAALLAVAGDALPLAPLALAAGLHAVEACRAAGAASGLPDGCRARVLPYAAAVSPLAVSPSRGVGFVLAGFQRALLFDLEEDEEEGEEAEGGGDQEMGEGGLITPGG